MRIRHPAAWEGKKIVILVGGGFAGLNAAKELSRSPEVAVILIDQRNYHLFQPLLYQVATAGLNSGDIAVPIRSQFSVSSNVHVHLNQVVGVRLADRLIRVANAGKELQIEYDYLVLACGGQHSYFGHPEWEEFAPGLKSLEHAAEIRRRILLSFERAENEIDPERQETFLTFVVVGGGPGVLDDDRAESDARPDHRRLLVCHQFAWINAWPDIGGIDHRCRLRR